MHKEPQTNPAFTPRRLSALLLPALLTACVNAPQVAGPSAITQNPWRASASEALERSGPIRAQGSGSEISYYVDCELGRDNQDGRSPAQAWRSLERANRAVLTGGQALLLRRGCTFRGPLQANWTGTEDRPVFIGAYGEGALPVVRGESDGPVVHIGGRHQVIQNLAVTAATPPGDAGLWNCPRQPRGWRTGFSFQPSSANNVVEYSRASGLTAGVHFRGGQGNKALHNVLVNNNVMSRITPRHQAPDDDSGAWGVLLNADGNEVAYNYFEGNTACSEDYGVEGASVEVFQASRNYVHHNISVNETTFAELGGSAGRPSSDNTFVYNLYAPVDTGGEMLVVRGPGSKWGGNPGTKFHNNTGYRVTLGISCSDGCSSGILSAHNNILWARPGAGRDLLFADGPFDEGHNLLWAESGRPRVTYPGGSLGPSSRIAMPAFVDPAGLDFRLASGSPGRGAALRAPIEALGVQRDVHGTQLGSGPTDIGAVQASR